MPDIVKKYKVELLFLLIFLVLVPVAHTIRYWQNDEWAYYYNVDNFLHGNFKTHPLTTPTFYSTGLLAAVFSLFFGINNLPILTLAVSVLCLYLLQKILVRDCGLSPLNAALTSLLLGTCPLFVFTTWGFMTDNYFLLWFLAAIYFFNAAIKYSSLKNIGLGIFFTILSYFTRQLGFILPLGYAFWFLLNKKFKTGAVLLATFLLIGLYHLVFFPKPAVMLESRLNFSNIFYFRYVFSLFWSIGITLVQFLLPAFIFYVGQRISLMKKQDIFVTVFLTCLILIAGEILFKNIGWINEHIFFFKYTVAQKGFFVENLHGMKTSFAGAGLIYALWEWVSKLALSGTLAVFLFEKNKLRLANQYFWLTGIYFGILVISPKVYDRYLLPLLPLALLWIFTLKPKITINFPAAVFWIFITAFYSYNFSADYIKTNNYVYQKAESLLSSQNIEPRQIVASDLWRYKYPETDEPEIYKFTYDDPSQQNYGTDYSLEDSYKVMYPLNFWKDKNTVYLYFKDWH